MYKTDFRAVHYSYRLFSGKNALDNLPAEVARLKRKRAFIVSGRTVSRQTPLVSSMRAALGDSCAGVFDEIDKDTSRSSVVRAADAARAAGADLVVGVGAGSVIQGARIVTILLAEQRPIEELITRYPDEGPAISARLMEPKLPIINVLTAPTTAQNRAGSRMKDDESARGMEFFDPKTRPAAIFWDEDALSTAPAQMIRTGAAGLYARAVMNLGGVAINPLVEGDRLQAYRLIAGALPRLADPADPRPRYDLCAATLLQNRENDDGGAQFERLWAVRVAYALSTALISVCSHVSQGEAYSAIMATVTRNLGPRDQDAMTRIARALGAGEIGAQEKAPPWIASHFEGQFKSIGMPTRLSALKIDRALFPQLIEHSLKNFNADPKREFAREPQTLEAVLNTAW